ncbi:MAG TPA: Stp1/IreP family PP2C-type Ser/Thr phosphatase [Candidatus Xenobia bacterium]|nr:Stp1/IreP family PP2C-type Ser/Thr phosphatase [Candidatus Xenobia bacterium]
MRLRVGAATDVGQKRSLNEDAYASNPARGLFVVCDGMGGAAAGEVASQMAIETIQSYLNGTPPSGKPGGDTGGYMERTVRLAEAIRASNRAIYERAQEDRKKAGMGTTVVGAWIGDSIASIAHVGDSRAYLWHQQKLEPITEDHSLVQAQVKAGLLRADQVEESKQRSVLLRALGQEPSVEVDVSEIPLRPGDYLLLCSDGLTRVVTDAGLARAIDTLREPQRICDYLIETANHNGGPDNITVVVVYVAGTFWQEVWNWLRG